MESCGARRRRWPLVITKDGDHEVIPDVRTLTSLDTDRHHLHVIGPSAPEVVGRVGGWMFDRAMAGWDVTVFIPSLQDARPLRILGARADCYGSAVGSIETWPGHVALAVAAEVFEDNAPVHTLVNKVLAENSCEVAIWGDMRSADVGARLLRTSYRLSPAATAFKKHALAAATLIPSSDTAGSEAFYSNFAHLLQPEMAYAEGRVTP